MAIFHLYPVTCFCGELLTALLAQSVNAGRNPEIKEIIKTGKFHKIFCPNCQKNFTIEKEFYYSDFTNNVFFKVLPRQERHLWKRASIQLESDLKEIPKSFPGITNVHQRVVFGLGELREKIIAHENGIDDRVLELLKIHIINEHPFLLNHSRLRILLYQVAENTIEFIATYDHDGLSFVIKIPNVIFREYQNEEEKLKFWVTKAHCENIFELKQDYWINIWRWSPQPAALEILRQNAENIRQGKIVNTNSEEFEIMLTGLPSGSNLPNWAKQDLQLIFNYAKEKEDSLLQEKLFEIRFGKQLEDDWARNNDVNDIDTIWNLLKDLPPSNVEGNVFINEIKFDEIEDLSSYRDNIIYISSSILQDKNKFTRDLRHEVGHAVHEKYKQIIDQWLEQRFGWQKFESDDNGIDAWVELMGGWKRISTQHKQEVRNRIRMALGPGGEWFPTPLPAMPSDHPWHKRDFGPRLAFEKSPSEWYKNYKKYHSFGVKSFFMNYQYKSLYAVNTDSLSLIDIMPRNYAAMSDLEFFAELYAFYFDNFDINRAQIPEDISNWFKNNLVNAIPTLV